MIEFIEYSDGQTEEIFVDQRPDWMRLVDGAGVLRPEAVSRPATAPVRVSDEEPTEEN